MPVQIRQGTYNLGIGNLTQPTVRAGDSGAALGTLSGGYTADQYEAVFQKAYQEGKVSSRQEFNDIIKKYEKDQKALKTDEDLVKSIFSDTKEINRSSYYLQGCEKKLQNLEKFSYAFIAFLTVATGIILCTTLGYTNSVTHGVKIFMVVAGIVAILTAIGELWYIFVKKDTVKYNVLAIINLMVYFLCIVASGIAYYDLTLAEKAEREGVELITTALVLSSIGLIMNFAFSFFIVLYKV